MTERTIERVTKDIKNAKRRLKAKPQTLKKAKEILRAIKILSKELNELEKMEPFKDLNLGETKQGTERKREPRENEGRPSKYREEFCKWLIEHMKTGHSYATFPAYVYEKTKGEVWISLPVLYDYEDAHPEFLEAKRTAVSLSQNWWENVGGAMGTGSLRRVKSETTVVDKQGHQTKTKEYEHTPGNSTVWNVTMRNRFGYQERVKIDARVTNLNKNVDGMTLQEINKELEELKKLNKDEE